MRLTRRQKQLLAGGLATTAAAYVTYRWYAGRRGRQASRLSRLLTAGGQYSDALIDLAEVSRTFAAELRSFMAGQTDQVPASLRQLALLARSPDATATLRTLATALRDGLLQDRNGASGAASPARPAADVLLDALASERGQTLVSLAVSVGTRNLVGALLEAHGLQTAPTAGDGAAPAAAAGTAPQPHAWMHTFFDILATPKGRDVMTLALNLFVQRAMSMWLASTADIDVADQLLRALSRPGHREAVEAITAVATKTAVRSLVIATRERPAPSDAAELARLYAPQPATPPTPASPSPPAPAPAPAPAAPATRSASAPPPAHRRAGVASSSDASDALDLACGSLTPMSDAPVAASDAESFGSGASEAASARSTGSARAGGGGFTLAHALQQVVHNADHRAFVLSLAGTATGEAARAVMGSVRDWCAGVGSFRAPPGKAEQATGGQRQWQRLPLQRRVAGGCVSLALAACLLAVLAAWLLFTQSVLKRAHLHLVP